MADYPEKPKRGRSPWRHSLVKFFIILAIVLIVLFACMVIGARLPGAT